MCQICAAHGSHELTIKKMECPKDWRVYLAGLGEPNPKNLIKMF